jgi:hypothetical protein
MADAKKIDSDITGFRYSEETAIGVADGSAIWYPLEPNSYEDFGGEYTLVARNPINSGRQRQKGVITDLDASGGYTTDITQSPIMQDLLQGFMFADYRSPAQVTVTAVDPDTVNPDEYECAASTGFIVGNLIKGFNFSNAANNAMNRVTVVTGTTVEVATGLLVAETPPATAFIRVVGHQVVTAGDIDIANPGGGVLPNMVSASLDFTTLPLVPGMWMFLGGDSAGTQFSNSANNTWVRVYSVAAHKVEFDQTDTTLVAEDNSATSNSNIRMWFGRVLKNEADVTNQVRHTYQLERTLGASDTASPTQIQSEYLVGSVGNELEMKFELASKAESTLNFVSIDHEQRTGVVGVKAGTRPALVSYDAYNTSNDFRRLKMSILDRTGSANPSALFAKMTELTLTVNNNCSVNKALGDLGGFDITAGEFQVDGAATVYFNNVTAIEAVKDNSDVTMSAIMIKSNVGFAVDIPLIALGDGRADIAKNEPVMVDLDMPAAADRVFNHTLLFCFFDYLPDLAAVKP